MKKTILIALVTVAILLAFTLTACDDNTPKDILDRTTWQQTHPTQGIVTFKFNSPSFTMTIAGNVMSGSYTVSGNTATLSVQGTLFRGEITGNTMKVFDSGSSTGTAAFELTKQ